MHYRIKENKRMELQEGRTIQYLAKKCKYSRQYLTDTFNKKNLITRQCAVNIIKGAAEDSLKLNTMLNQKGINETINYFFEKVE